MASFTSESRDWKDDLRDRLIKLFADRPESLLRLLHYLDEEEKAYRNSVAIPPVWKTLRATAAVDALFKSCAEGLIEDTKKAENDPVFRLKMNRVYEEMMDADESPLAEEEHQGFDILRIEEINVESVSALVGFAHAWAIVPSNSKGQILSTLSKLISNRQLMTCVDEVAGLVSKTGGNVVMIGLAVLQLGYDVIKNLIAWWKGEITGKRCCKNIIDSFVTIGGGVGGGIVGAMAGSLVGPVGTVIGGVAGGFASAHVAGIISDRVTQTLFGIPKDKALENAYNFMGVKMTASNDEINKAFRRLCLEHHPDKGGKQENFIEVQLNMGVIKLARGEMFA